jgi:hypothetical protein
MSTDFAAIFSRLRRILEPHSTSFKVSADDPEHFCLEVPYSPKLKKGFPIAWVKTSKSYVSYHFIPVYMFPKLREGLSNELRARMQGKSCFNFKSLDEPLFEELNRMTANGFVMSRKAGFIPEEQSK